jgi:hypothetical protein
VEPRTVSVRQVNSYSACLVVSFKFHDSNLSHMTANTKLPDDSAIQVMELIPVGRV